MRSVIVNILVAVLAQSHVEHLQANTADGEQDVIVASGQQDAVVRFPADSVDRLVDTVIGRFQRTLQVSPWNSVESAVEAEHSKRNPLFRFIAAFSAPLWWCIRPDSLDRRTLRFLDERTESEVARHLSIRSRRRNSQDGLDSETQGALMNEAVMIFKEHDRELKGFMNEDEFREVAKVELGIDRDGFRQLLNVVDLNGDGTVTMDEFIRFWISDGDEDEAIEKFKQTDRDGNGFISKEDMYEAAHGLFRAQDLRKLFDQADADGDGNISLEEFIRWRKSFHERVGFPIA